MNKGQIDLFGLVIIVVLLVFIGLFSLVFINKGDTKDTSVYSSLKVENFANALSKASIGSSSFESLALSCCSGRNEDCSGLLEFVETESLKMELAENTAKSLKFELICRSGAKPTYGSCSLGKASESIILGSGDSIKLYLCDN